MYGIGPQAPNPIDATTIADAAAASASRGLFNAVFIKKQAWNVIREVLHVLKPFDYTPVANNAPADSMHPQRKLSVDTATMLLHSIALAATDFNVSSPSIVNQLLAIVATLTTQACCADRGSAPGFVSQSETIPLTPVCEL